MMTHFLRDGFGTTVAAAIASAFYGGPLVIAVLVGGGGVPPRAALDPAEAPWERVAVWLPDEGDDEPEADEVVAVLAPADPQEAEAIQVDPSEVDGQADVLPVEAVGGGAPGAAGGTADVGGEGTGGGVGDGQGAGDGAGDGAGAQPAKVAKKKRKSGCDRPHPNIRPGDDGVMEVDRSIVEKYTKNLETFVSLGYSRPFDEGELKGWYISGFSCVSVVHKAGFRRGDVLLSVNGKRTRSWVGVFMMYQKLKNKDDFEVELVRKGEPMKLRFRVVDDAPATAAAG